MTVRLCSWRGGIMVRELVFGRTPAWASYEEFFSDLQKDERYWNFFHNPGESFTLMYRDGESYTSRGIPPFVGDEDFDWWLRNAWKTACQYQR